MANIKHNEHVMCPLNKLHARLGIPTHISAPVQIGVGVVTMVSAALLVTGVLRVEECVAALIVLCYVAFMVYTTPDDEVISTETPLTTVTVVPSRVVPKPYIL